MKLTPVSGQTNIYTMERMDQPTELGTPISKATLLKDSTAELYGLGPDAVPDDIFRALAAPDYAAKLIIHVATADGGSVGNTRVRIRNEELGVYLVKSLDALGNAEFDVLQNHTYYVVLLDYPSQYYGAAALITATGGQVQRETITLPTEPDIIGWRIDESTGTVEYTDGAKSWIPASMVGDTFEPGSLGGSWLFKNIRPCLLKNGIVQYYLDPNDFSKRTDGTDADITSGDDGDVMIEFPLVFYKFYEETNPDGQTWKGCKFSRTQPDNTYCANAYLSEAGVIQQTMYMSAYEGAVLDNKLRSISGVKEPKNYVIQEWRLYAARNGKGYQQQEWTKRVLLQAMFVMMFRSVDSQSALGMGRLVDEDIESGVLNKKGMFWGSQDTAVGVKFCGIEHLWGGSRKACDGLKIAARSYLYKIRAPYSDNVSDGTFDPFYSASASFMDKYINAMSFSNVYGMLPSATNSNSGVYYDTCAHARESSECYIRTGIERGSELYPGIFCFGYSITNQQISSAYLSYTPQGG